MRLVADSTRHARALVLAEAEVNQSLSSCGRARFYKYSVSSTVSVCHKLSFLIASLGAFLSPERDPQLFSQQDDLCFHHSAGAVSVLRATTLNLEPV